MADRGLTYPQRLVQALYTALEQTAGPSSLAEVLKQAGVRGPKSGIPPGPLDFVEIAAFNAALTTVYGERGGRGVAQRTGNALFNIGLKQYGVLNGITAPQFARLPTTAQAHLSLMGLAAVFSHISDQATHLHDRGESWHIIVDPSPFAWGLHTDKPTCQLLMGTWQACLSWATNGYEFVIYETDCMACGAAYCTFQINKRPIGRDMRDTDG